MQAFAEEVLQVSSNRYNGLLKELPFMLLAVCNVHWLTETQYNEPYYT